MAVFTEIIDGCRTAPRRGIEFNPGTKELTIKAGKKATTYTVTRFPADGGNGYRLAKLHSTDVYDVFTARVGGEWFSSCTCRGFESCRTGARPVCRHLLAIEALEENADLIGRTEEPAAEATPTPEEALQQVLDNLYPNKFTVPTTPAPAKKSALTKWDREQEASYRW
jgi:hypothetical protein